jgi:hypothetical protein
MPLRWDWLRRGCCTGVGFGLETGSGSAKRTVGGEDFLLKLTTTSCVDLRLGFIDDRLGLLDADVDVEEA